MKTTNERIFANDIKMSYWQQDNCMRCAKAVWYNTQLGRCPKYKCALQRDMEAQAAGKRANLEVYNDGTFNSSENFKVLIKDTLEDEMADVAIRLGDLAGALGVDFDKMNPCKYHRAFDKFTFTENAFALTKGLCRDIIGIEKRIQFGLEYVTKWAKSINIDLDWHIDEKMKYNATLPPKHGKAY